MKSHFGWIHDRFDLNKAERVVFAGGSVGGAGVFLWMDYLKAMVDEPDKIVGIIDSGRLTNPYIIRFALSQRQQFAQLFKIPPVRRNRNLQIVNDNSNGTNS